MKNKQRKPLLQFTGLGRSAATALLLAANALPLFAVNYTLGFGAVEAVYTLDGGPIGGQSPAFAQFLNDPAEAVGIGVGLLLDGSVNISGVSPVAGDIYPVACGTTLPLFTYPFANVVPLYASGTSQPTPQPPHSGTFVMYPATYQDTDPFTGVPVTPGDTDAGCIPYWVNLRHDLTATGRKHIYAKTYRTDPLLPYIAANENPLFPFPATPVDKHTDIELVGAIHLRVFCGTNADGSPRLLNAEANGDFITARIPASPPFTLPVCDPPYRNPQGGLASLTGESGTLRASVSAQAPLGAGGPVEEMFLAPAGQSYVVNVEFRTWDLAGPVLGAYTTTSPVVQPGQIVSVDITVDEVHCDGGSGCISSIGRVEVLGTSIFESWAPDPDPLFFKGPFLNVRHATVTRDCPTCPGGSWEVRSVLPSVPGPGQSWGISPYTPRAILYFGIPSGYSEVMDMYSTPTNLTCQSPVIDFGDLWVIDPGFVKGEISLDGRACGGPISCLQLIKSVNDLPPLGANFMTESVAFANGPGAVITTIRNSSSSATYWKGTYEMYLGAEYRAPSSVWNTGNLLLLLDTPGFPSTLQIRDWLVYNTPLTVQAGQSYTNKHNYCVSEVRMTLVNPSGFEIGNPSVKADGYYDERNPPNPIEPAFYSVFSTFHGTPVYPNYTTGNASIALCLLQGDYTLTPAVSYRINGTEGSTQFPPFQMKVGCKQCINVEVSTNGVGAIISLNNMADCTLLANYVLQGTVSAATNHLITNVNYMINGGTPVVLCSGAGCGAVFDLGGVSIPLMPCANTLTLSAMDDQGLSGSTTFTVTRDSTPPILTVPTTGLDLGCNPNSAALPTDASVAAASSATDTCSATAITATHTDSMAGCVATRDFAVAATDACLNVTTLHVLYTWTVDTTAPTFVGFPANAVVECPGDTTPTATGAPTGDDTCSSGTISHGDSETSGACEGQVVKVITRTWTVTDACGNNASQAQTITVKDMTAPTFVGFPANAIVECPGDTGPTATGAPTGADGCGGTTITHSDSETSGACEGQVVKVITRTWTVTDTCGNNASQVQTITVKDTTAPTFVDFPTDAIVECPGDTSPTATGAPTGADTCSSGTISHSDSETSAACVGQVVKVITRTWTVTDACCNTASQVQTITVRDTTAPTFVGFPTDAIVECLGDTSPTATGAPTGADTCSNGTISRSDSETSGACVGQVVKVITRTWTVTDACGNTASQAQTITVKDTTAPTFVGSPGDAVVECPGDTSPTATGAPTGADTCSSGTISHSDSETTGACAGQVVKVITRTWTVTDACGNSASQPQTITVKDTTVPTFVGFPANAVVECPGDTTPTATGAPTGADTCSSGTITHSDSETTGACVGQVVKVITRTWTVTDACGNSASQPQTITVKDTTPPVISGCQNVSVTAPACEAGATVSFTVSATDTCDPNVLVTCSRGPGFFGIGQTTVTCEAVDRCGNRTPCSFTVTVGGGTSGLCSFTQGFYGGKGKFNGIPALTIIGNLLAQGTLVVGKLGVRSLSIQPADAGLLQSRLPGGTTPATLPSTGGLNQTLATAVLPLNSKFKFVNNLLSQTITLSLNVRLRPALLNLGITPSFCTVATLAGPDGCSGTSDDVLITTDKQKFNTPNSVLTALADATLGINNSTVQGLLELANRALAGLPTGAASLADINAGVDAINKGFDACRVRVDCATGVVIQDSYNDGFNGRPPLESGGSGGPLASGLGGPAGSPPPPPPPPASCSFNIRTRSSNHNATKEPGEPDHAGNAGGKSVWWQWRAPRSGPVVIATAGSDFDTLLAVYIGTAISNLVWVAGNDDVDESLTSEVSFNAVLGTDYQIAVDGFDGNSGAIVLTLIADVPKIQLLTLLPNGERQIRLEGDPTCPYNVEGSSDLRNWTPIPTTQSGDGTLQFTDPEAANVPHRFYRVLAQF